MSGINGKAYWAAVASPNTTFDPDGMWTVDVCNLDEKNVKLAKKDGISIKNNNISFNCFKDILYSLDNINIARIANGHLRLFLILINILLDRLI